MFRRFFAADAAPKAAETPRGPFASIFAFLPRWGAPYGCYQVIVNYRGFWRKLGFYFCLILVVNGLINVGYYTFDHCYGVLANNNGRWKLKSTNYDRYHQFELIFNFPAGIMTFLIFLND